MAKKQKNERAIYKKTAIDIGAQIKTLENDGLCIDIPNAEFYLERINYFRFARYLVSFKTNNIKDKADPSHKYAKDSTFSKVLNLYYFDKELRSFIFTAIQSIEIAFRSKIINNFSAVDPHWFCNKELHIKEKFYISNLDSIQKEVKRSKEEFIVEYCKEYYLPALPPAWKTLEILSFGAISKLYNNFKVWKSKTEIAVYFELPNANTLSSWLGIIAVLRNHCAHHARVWNRTFVVTPIIPSILEDSFKEYTTNTSTKNKKLYTPLCCIKKMLDVIYPDNNFANELDDLLQKYRGSIKINPMGFPLDWKDRDLWKSKINP